MCTTPVPAPEQTARALFPSLKFPARNDSASIAPPVEAPAPALSIPKTTPNEMPGKDITETAGEKPAAPVTTQIPADMLTPNEATILRTLQLFHAPGDTVELRSPATAEGTYCGFYDDFAVMAKDAADLSSLETTPNVYHGLQTLKSFADLCAAKPELSKQNQINTAYHYSPKGAPAEDSDVLRYRWLPIDCDPVRVNAPAKSPSTDAEKGAAKTLAREVRAFLTSQGIESIAADSGNGYHLPVRIDLENTPSNEALIKALLYALDAKFGTSAVHIDTSLHNPSRILKLYGTIARKGVNTVERPWRATRLISVPDGIQDRPVSEEKLRALLSTLGGVIGAAPASTSESSAGTPVVTGTKLPDGWMDEPIYEGEIHNTMVKIAAKLRGAGLNTDEIKAVLHRKAETQCFFPNSRTPFSPIDYDNLDAIAEHAGTKLTNEQQRQLEKPIIHEGAQMSAPVQDAKMTPAEIEKVKDNQRAKLEKDVEEYEALQDKCDESTTTAWASYPVEAWADTAYSLFAETCQAGNHIPLEFFINVLMTYVGAIAGHRIYPAFNPKLRARFITFLLSRRGGVGKNEAIGWGRDLFGASALVRKAGSNAHQNIGCFTTDFGSARGMLEVFERHPVVLQVYDELGSLFEKFGISGSGEAFKNLNLGLADENEANWSIIAGWKPKGDLPKEVHNSILGGTTLERWEETSANHNLETWIQRTNMILSEETRTVFKLVVPDLDEVRKVLMPRIGILETHKLVWDYTPEAEALGERWHQQLSSSDDDAVTESVGRIQVYLMRVIGHLALCLAPLPTDDAPADTSTFDSQGHYIPRSNQTDKIWKVEVTADMVRRAIQIADNQMLNRAATMPSRGITLDAIVENLIRKYVATGPAEQRWSGPRGLKRRLRKYGRKLSVSTLLGLEKEGVLEVRTQPGANDDEDGWIIVRKKKPGWVETRRSRASDNARLLALPKTIK
jgi:hypothetical protein